MADNIVGFVKVFVLLLLHYKIYFVETIFMFSKPSCTECICD